MLLRANARGVRAAGAQHWMPRPNLSLTCSQSTSSSAVEHALLLQSDAEKTSPVTRVCFRGQCVHVKRDDVFHLAGNKVRLRTRYYLLCSLYEYHVLLLMIRV